MSNTTQTLVLDLAPELSTATAQQFQQGIEAAKAIVTYTKYGTTQQLAQTYLAAHFITEIVDTSGGGGSGGSGLVTMEKVDDVERHYDVTTSTTSTTTSGQQYNRTKYGRIFLSLEKRLVEYT